MKTITPTKTNNKEEKLKHKKQTISELATQD
jgi:hypothetical protein